MPPRLPPIEAPESAGPLAALGLTLGRLTPAEVLTAWACADAGTPWPPALATAVEAAYPDPGERAAIIAAAMACTVPTTCHPDAR